MNISEKPIAVDIIHVQDKIGNPVILLSTPVLPFSPGQQVYASIYNDKIIITPIIPEITD